MTTCEDGGKNAESDIQKRVPMNKIRLYFNLRSCLIFLAIVGFVFITGGVLVIFFFRDFVDSIIISNLSLRENSKVTNSWLRPPVRPLMKIYVFNLTNLEEFLSGSKPVFREMGPYVYEQIWEKSQVSWMDDGVTVQYIQKKKFFFIRNLSIGSEDNLALVPNIPLLSAFSRIRHAGKIVRLAVGSMLELLDQLPFQKLTIKQIVWGSFNPLLKLANDVVPKAQQYPSDKFGILVGKNGTSTNGFVRVKTGLYNAKDAGQIISVDGKDKLDFWKTNECNSIRGTDGSFFHPQILRNATLRIFHTDLCRSLPLVYQKDIISTGGIPGYRFVPAVNVFAPPDVNPYNSCFCKDEDCLSVPSGLFNISACQFGSPLLLSWPHFFQADPKLLEAVEGLMPDEEKHQFYIDVQPKLGTSLRAAARTQINVVMTSIEDVNVAKGIRDIVYPVMWFSDGIDGIDDDGTISLIRKALYAPEIARAAIYPSLLASGTLLVLLVIGCLLKQNFSLLSTSFDGGQGSKEDVSLQVVAHKKECDRAYTDFKPVVINTRNGICTNGHAV